MSIQSSPPTAADPFGIHLRHWRQHRRLSQLDLANEARMGVAKHDFVSIVINTDPDHLDLLVL